MSRSLFELPAPRELGNGWSLRFLTAGQMLECRDEGEARAKEERDKALWANAALLSRVLLKEGEPAFPDGEAVLASLTVGQMDSLTRRWWAQDDFSTRASGEERTAREEWTAREGSENEHFDMARFLALGGAAEPSHGDPAGEEGISVGSSALSGFPEVWPGRTLLLRTPAAAGGIYERPPMDRGEAMPYGGGAVPEALLEAVPRVLPERAPTEVFLSLPKKEAGAEEPVRGEPSVARVSLPEPEQARPGLTVEELDRAVERDARRYDGGLTHL